MRIHKLKYIIFIFTAIAVLFYGLSVSYAVVAPTSSPTGAPTAANEQVKESLQERLKKAADEKSSEAEKILGDTERRAVVGTLKDIAQTSLTIQVKDKASQLASIGDKTVFLRNGKSAKQSDLAIGDYILAMGYPGDGNVLDARRVVALDKQPPKTEYIIAAGSVIKINTTSKTFTVETVRPAELGGPETLVVSVAKTDLDLATLEKDKRMIVIAVSGKTSDSPLVLKAYKIL